MSIQAPPPEGLDPIYNSCAMAVLDEIVRAKKKHPGNFASPHEGFAILKEEVDELWDEIKKDGGGRGLASYKEAKQVAAMAIRYMVELARVPGSS